MAFLDEEEALPLDDAPLPPQRGGRTPRSPRQQIMVRRLFAVAAGVLFLILVVLGVKGCLDARRDRAIKNFVSDTSALMNDSSQVGTDFFRALSTPPTTSQATTQFNAQVKSYRGACETLYQRGQSLSTPDEMKDPKNAMVIALKMRVDAMTVIANNIDTATASSSAASAKQNTLAAQKAISDQMKVLYSSDYVYSTVALPEIKAVLQKQGITNIPATQSPSVVAPTTLGSSSGSSTTGGSITGSSGTSSTSSPAIPPSTVGTTATLAGNFIPPPAEKWLSLSTVTSALNAVSGSTTTATPGTHGLILVKTTIGNTTLSSTAPATVTAPGTPQISVEVQNGGGTTETGVTVNVTIAGSTLTGTIPSIAAGSTQTVRIPITPAPPTGTQTTVQVSVQPVPGETTTTNNTASYTVTFQ